MAFRIEVEPQALQDLDWIAEYIKTNSSSVVAEKLVQWHHRCDRRFAGYAIAVPSRA